MLKMYFGYFIRDEKLLCYSGLVYMRVSAMKMGFNQSLILLTLLCMSAIIIWFNNYKNNIKPTFLKVFQMMSGFITTVSIGLTIRQDIMSLLNRNQNIVQIIRYNNDFIVPIFIIILICVCIQYIVI